MLLWPSGCIEYLQPGELGTPRYFGEVRGDDPLPVLPPISDRAGNTYILVGSENQPDVDVFVGQAGGGGTAGCSLSESDIGGRGAHGWVGATDDRAWFHAGDGLFEVSGSSGGCRRILEVNPTTGTSLAFLSVLPHVEESPSRTFLRALIQAPSDPRPYFVTVDLDLAIFTEINEIDIGSDFAAIGAGWDEETQSGAYVVQFEIDGALRTEAWFINSFGDLEETPTIEDGAEFAEDGILGWLQFGRPAPVAGLLSDGQILIFNRDEGITKTHSQLQGRGVHPWEDRLWLVGLGSSGDPMLSEIGTGGDFADAVLWNASIEASESLERELQVLDDTVVPGRLRSWDDPRAVPGESPFLHPHPPHRYAQQTTLMTLGGPSFDFLDTRQTSTAFVPVGISYP
jgi:hypothetical protein